MSQGAYGMADVESDEGKPLPDGEVKRMVANYLDSIEKPKLSASKPFFFCPVGLIGSGKSTVTRHIAEHFGLARVSGDEIRAQLRNGGYSFKRTLDIAYGTIRELAREGCGIAVDSDCASPRVREVLARLGDEFGYPLIFVHVTAPEFVLLERNQRRDEEHPDVHGEDWVSGLHRRKPLHESQNLAGINFVYAFDTSRDDMATQLSDAVTVIESELHNG